MDSDIDQVYAVVGSGPSPGGGGQQIYRGGKEVGRLTRIKL